METFKIAKSNFILPVGHVTMPVGAVYGKFTTTYLHHRKQIVTKAGKPATKKYFKTETFYYMVTDFRAVGKNLDYFIKVYDEEKNRWFEVSTESHVKYYALRRFLAKKFEEYDLRPTRRVKYCDREGIPGLKECPIPHERIGKVGYALNSRITTEHSCSNKIGFKDWR